MTPMTHSHTMRTPLLLAALLAAAPVGAQPPRVETEVPVAPPPSAEPAAERRLVDVPIVDSGASVAGSESDLSLAARAAALLGGVLDPDDGAAVAVGGGAADYEQSVGGALFAAPVAGSIPYVVGTQVYHHTTIVFPPGWQVVDVLVGDQHRWAVHRAGPLVLVQPGEPGARTNLTVVLATGEVLQMDLQEITGLVGSRRVGRVYVGPEGWLIDRIFGMLPLAVRERVAASPVSVAQLLADPLMVVGLYGGTGAVPNPAFAEARSPGAAAPPADGAFDPLPPPASVPSSGDPLPEPAPPAPGAAHYVPASEVSAEDARLAAVLDQVGAARRAAGDRIAAAQLALETDLEALREDYPARIQFSYVLEPELPPYTEPFWHFGVWHDGEHTFWRLLALDPVFLDVDADEELAAEPLGDFVYRLPRVVERGAVRVHADDGSVLDRLFYRRRREMEGP